MNWQQLEKASGCGDVHAAIHMTPVIKSKLATGNCVTMKEIRREGGQTHRQKTKFWRKFNALLLQLMLSLVQYNAASEWLS